MQIRLPAKKPHTPQSKISDSNCPNTSTLPETLLSIKQAAKYAGVSDITVRRWIKSDKFLIYRAGKQIRIDKTDLVEYMRQ